MQTLGISILPVNLSGSERSFDPENWDPPVIIAMAEQISIYLDDVPVKIV